MSRPRTAADAAGGGTALDCSPAADAPAFSDAGVNLLYRSGLDPQRFCAELREQADTTAMLRLARTAFAATELGSRTRWLWRPLVSWWAPNWSICAR